MQQKNCVMQRQSTTLHDKKRMQVDLCREKSWKAVKSRCNKNCVMQRQSTTLHDKICMQANLCREKSWKVDATKKLCYATTKHDFTRQETHTGKLMSWKVVKSRCNKKNCVMQRQSTTLHDKKYIQVDRLMSWKAVKSRCNKKRCYATTKHDFARQEMYAGKLMSWKVVKSRCNIRQSRCNKKARPNTTLYLKLLLFTLLYLI